MPPLWAGEPISPTWAPDFPSKTSSWPSAPPLTKNSPLGAYATQLTKFLWFCKEAACGRRSKKRAGSKHAENENNQWSSRCWFPLKMKSKDEKENDFQTLLIFTRCQTEMGPERSSQLHFYSRCGSPCLENCNLAREPSLFTRSRTNISKSFYVCNIVESIV